MTRTRAFTPLDQSSDGSGLPGSLSGPGNLSRGRNLNRNTGAGRRRLVDITFADDRWRQTELEQLSEEVCRRALEATGKDWTEWEIGLLACDDACIAGLNRRFRGVNRPTNVLSWPVAAAPAFPAGELRSLGEMALSVDTCTREAPDSDKGMSGHLAHLALHGCLHLLGYGHDTNNKATQMERLEVAILASMGIDNPYCAGVSPCASTDRRKDI